MPFASLLSCRARLSMPRPVLAHFSKDCNTERNKKCDMEMCRTRSHIWCVCACVRVRVCVCVRARATRTGSQSQNDRKLIPLYVMDSILKNVQPMGVYATIVDKVRSVPFDRASRAAGMKD